MKTDRELLELAAKAAGYFYQNNTIRITLDGENKWLPWNPLTDDGDALRLAVKLDFRIDVDKDRAWAAVMTPRHLGIDSILETNENGDPYGATRRAIVRAAAAIGEESEKV